MFITQMHPGDILGRNAIATVLNSGHDKRIKQTSLDFYRNAWKEFYDNNGIITFLVGLDDIGEPIALSAFGHRAYGKRVLNSITIVHPNFRKMGHGKTILSAKMDILRSRYPGIKYKGFVNKTNEPSIKMCSSVGLMLVGEGKRDREGKDSTNFFIFEDMQ